MIVTASAAEPQNASAPVAPAKVKDIKAYCLDFNWGVLVNRDSVRHSLGRVEGQDAGFPSDLVFTRCDEACREGERRLFDSKISW